MKHRNWTGYYKKRHIAKTDEQLIIQAETKYILGDCITNVISAQI